MACFSLDQKPVFLICISFNQWQMLKQPENIVLNDFKQHRAAALDAHLIGQYEELVTDWINTIETMLNDTSDERYPGTSFLPTNYFLSTLTKFHHPFA